MKPAWSSPAGLAALERLLAGRALLAFDFDGTLAPFVDQPADACAPSAWTGWLRTLAAHWPLAVLSGRAVDDLSHRLGFEPRFIAGNHGAQARGGSATGPLASMLDGCRSWLHDHRNDWAPLGIRVEDKGLSLALHSRGADDPAAVGRFAALLARAADAAVKVSHGHAVTNIVPRTAPDKGDALRAALAECGADRALYVGDDVNDEPAFDKAPAGSVTIRVGPAHDTAARFRLRTQTEVGALLRHLCARTIAIRA